MDARLHPLNTAGLRAQSRGNACGSEHGLQPQFPPTPAPNWLCDSGQGSLLLNLGLLSPHTGSLCYAGSKISDVKEGWAQRHDQPQKSLRVRGHPLSNPHRGPVAQSQAAALSVPQFPPSYTRGA